MLLDVFTAWWSRTMASLDCGKMEELWSELSPGQRPIWKRSDVHSMRVCLLAFNMRTEES